MKMNTHRDTSHKSKTAGERRKKEIKSTETKKKFHSKLGRKYFSSIYKAIETVDFGFFFLSCNCSSVVSHHARFVQWIKRTRRRRAREAERERKEEKKKRTGYTCRL